MIDLPTGMTQRNQANDVDPKTLDESYELSIRALDSYSQEVSAAETRLIGVIAIGSLIIGLLPVTRGDVNLTDWGYWPNWLLYSALATYLSAAFWVYRGLSGRRFYSVASFDPRVLREHYWQMDEVPFKKALHEEVEDALESNRRNLDRKNRYFLRVLPAVGLEIVLLLAWTFMRSAIPIS